MPLGLLAGREDFQVAVRLILPHTDGMVCSPGKISNDKGEISK